MTMALFIAMNVRIARDATTSTRVLLAGDPARLQGAGDRNDETTIAIDETNGETYYLARVELVETRAVAIDLDELYPGMQAEVMIVTGARSALDYLMEPLMKSFDRAFRES